MKKNTMIFALLTFSILFLAAGAGIASARGRSGIRVQANFDNATIHVARPGDRHLEIEVTAPGGHVREPADRPPMNIALVIDKSGSMAEAGKMRYVKEAAREMIDRLRYGDRFSLVAYDDDVRVLVRSEALEDRHRARRLIDGLYPGGSTNLGEGMLEGYRQVGRNYIEGGINRVLLLSDGLANRGITSPRELSRIVNRENRRGISLTSFGVGLDFNEDLLASLAESGRGTYYYIDQARRIPEILAREFSTVEQVVALNVVITIELRPRVVIEDVLGYEFHREGNRTVVRIGDMARGERRRIMARLSLPSLSAGGHRIGEVLMSYQPQGAKRSVRERQELRMQYLRDQASVDRNLNREVAERSFIFEANDARHKAARSVDRGDLEEAKSILGKSRKKLKEAAASGMAVKDELVETEGYQSAIESPMSPGERSSVQKSIKYRSYKVLQSK